MLVTKVKPKAEAVSEYTNAAQQGHSAALLQQQATSRLYEIKLGNLEAKQGCVVEFAYVQQLQSLAGALEFVHTATWVPPYVQAADAPEASESHCLYLYQPKTFSCTAAAYNVVCLVRDYSDPWHDGCMHATCYQ